MWTLAFRNILRQRARTGMTLLAIVVGVAGLILSGGFVHDIFHQLGETLIHSQSGHLQVARQGYFERGTRSPEKFIIEADAALRREVSQLPEVESAMGRLYFSGLINNGRTDLPIIAEGIEPAAEAALGSGIRIVAGRPLEAADSMGLMVGEGLARAMKLKPGDSVTLVINTAAGALNNLEFEVTGVFQTFSKDYDARAVRIPLAAAQELLATPGINTLVVALKQTADTERMAASLAARLGSRDMEVRTWVQLNDFYAKTVDMYDAQFGVLRLIILVMVLLSVANSVNMSVFERVGEFGAMRAMGNTTRDISRLIVAESALIGLAGTALGAASGIGLALAISAVGIPMPPPPNSDLGYTARILLVPSVIGGACAVGFIASIVAALLPAARVRKIPVVEALRQNV